MKFVVSADTYVSREMARDGKVQTIVNDISRTVNRYIQEGKGEIIIRKEGLAVITLGTLDMQKKIRSIIHRLIAQTGQFYNIFEDAEMNIEGYGYA